MWNKFKVNNKDTRMAIVNFEQVNADWDYTWSVAVRQEEHFDAVWSFEAYLWYPQFQYGKKIIKKGICHNFS